MKTILIAACVLASADGANFTTNTTAGASAETQIVSKTRGTTNETVAVSNEHIPVDAAARDRFLVSCFDRGSSNMTVYTISMGDMSQVQSFDHDLFTRPRTLEERPWNPDPGPRPYFGQTIR